MAERIEVIIDGDSYGLVQASGQGRTAIKALGTEVATQSRSVSAFNAVLDQQQRNLQDVGRFARTTGLVLGGAFAAGATAGVRLNAQWESLVASLTTLTGSAEKAQKFLERLREVSANSPLRLTEYAEAAQLMMGFGVETEKVLPLLESVNMAVVATGKGEEEMMRVALALGQIQSRGKASTEELNQLAEVGIPVNKILQRELGLTGDEVANIGDQGISAERTLAAIGRGWREEYGKSYEDARGTFNMQLSNLRKDFEQALRLGSEPLFELLRDDVMPRLNEELEIFVGILNRDISGDRKVALVRTELERLRDELDDLGLDEALIESINDAIPVIVKNAAAGGLEIAQAVVNGFTESDMWGKALLGYFIVKRLGIGGLIFRTAGARSATEFAAGATQGMAAQRSVMMAEAAATGTATGRAMATAQTAAYRSGMSTSRGGVVLPPGATGRQGSLPGGVPTTVPVPGRTPGSPSGSRLGGLGSAALGIGRGVLGVNLAMGLISGFASEAPTIEGRLQDVMSNVSLGLVDSWSEETEKAVAAMQDQMAGVNFESEGPFAETFKQLYSVQGEGIFKTLGDLTSNYDDAAAATERWRNRLDEAYASGEISEAQYEEMSKALNQAWRQFDRGQEKVGELNLEFKNFGNTWGLTLDEVRQRTDRNMRQIERTMDTRSREGRQAVTDNFNAARQAIQNSMDAGVTSVKEGTAEMDRQMHQQLRNYGIEDPQAFITRSEVETSNRASLQRKQLGGTLRDGLDILGTGSGDKVDLHAKVEPGEKVFVLNRNASERLRQLRALNAQVPRFQKGGELGIPQGGFPDAMGALPGMDALAYVLKQKFALGVTSGARPGAITTSGNPSDHGWGGAIDVSNGVTTPQMDAAHRWLNSVMGPAIKQILYRTMVGGNHYDHIHVALLEQYARSAEAVMRLIGGKGGLGALGGMSADIKLPRFHTELAGFVPQVAGLNNMAAGLEDEMSKRAAAVLGAAGSVIGGTHPNEGVYGKEALARLWRDVNGGLGDANIMAAISLAESSGNPKANGPPDGRGLWQIEWPVWAAFMRSKGLTDAFDAAQNTAMAGHVLREQGLGAWVVYNTGAYQQFLQKGGLVEEARHEMRRSRKQIRGLRRRGEHVDGRLYDLQSELSGAKGNRADRLREEVHAMKARSRRIERRMGLRQYELSAAEQLRDAAREQQKNRQLRDTLNEELGPILDAFPYLGAFRMGTGGRRVGRDGIATLHRDEVVIPDPKGGYANQLAAPGAGNDSPVDVRLTIGLDDSRLLKVVDARVDGRAANVVDREIGRQSRQITFAPGG